MTWSRQQRQKARLGMTPYDYRCETCSEIFVTRLEMGKEKPLVECPVCGSFVTKRIYISVPALSVKFGA
ncbi:MAG: hypothetical protein KAJ19_22940, partial [Gammaproteobacteria bacterium]|nr:hypothetical protein [Gammaproteobacteria bacterium]